MPHFYTTSTDKSVKCHTMPHCCHNEFVFYLADYQRCHTMPQMPHAFFRIFAFFDGKEKRTAIQ
ncbi:MAG: hypothetical protein K5899_07910 [Bacteroidaceae bacterium]|nr:hypothetical protein [Bacteroidaceae bacterium]